MKKRTLLLGALVSACGAAIAAPTVKAPKTIHSSAFAVIVDSETYNRTGKAVDRYRDAVEKNGLSAYIVIDEWERPEAVRQSILDLAKNQPPLEGVVLVGDIPIAMIRDAQHLTSAFKMDQDNPKRFPPIRSSVPSDRFYDDWDLQFTFIEQDSANPLLFYYSLDAAGPQHIAKEIYSARIHPPVKDESKYQAIADFLLRAAVEKEQKNPLDQILTFAGHGYNSESLSAWESELLSLREQFPRLYRPDAMIKNLYHTMNSELKEIVLLELSNPELDLAIFHAHGAEDMQYLLGETPAVSLGQRVESIRSFLRSKLRSAKRRKQSTAEAQLHYMRDHDIPLSWFAGAFVDSVQQADSLAEVKLDIYISDIESISPGARVMVFDQCFNGAFINHPYVAGSYLFNDGRTLVGMANSVNVAQDIWANELMGLFAHGVRIGLWHRTRSYLESHLFGDPTFQFAAPGTVDWNRQWLEHDDDSAFWRSQLESPEPELRNLAIYMLDRIEGESFTEELVRIYRSDPAFVVRLQAIRRLAHHRNAAFMDLLPTAIGDPCEFIRRCSVAWMGDVGRDDYLPLLVRQLIMDPSTRVSFRGKFAMEKIDIQKATELYASKIDALPEVASKDKLKEILIHSAERSQQWLTDDLLKRLHDDSLEVRKRIGSVRTFRNYRFQSVPQHLIQVAGDAKEPEALRVACLEALGWYTLSAARQSLIDFCENLSQDAAAPEAVRQEALKTHNRLIQGPNNSITP
ncbi:HEAT repeat domain-containing protein [candidate division KSB1 bacterium]|nr:HEAT repeat domain-containing protein [candidate division KSB1 bacterium]